MGEPRPVTFKDLGSSTVTIDAERVVAVASHSRSEEYPSTKLVTTAGDIYVRGLIEHVRERIWPSKAKQDGG